MHNMLFVATMASYDSTVTGCFEGVGQRPGAAYRVDGVTVTVAVWVLELADAVTVTGVDDVTVPARART